MTIGLSSARFIHDNGENIKVKYAAINASSSGDNTVVAAVSNKRIVIVGLFLIAADIVSVTFESGATNLTGAMPLSGKGGMVLPFNPVGYVVTRVNEAFIINLSSAVQVSGGLTYIEIDE